MTPNKIAKKKRGPGRPVSTGVGKIIGVRCHPPLLKRIDRWSGKQSDKPVRSEAIRRLVEMALSSANE